MQRVRFSYHVLRAHQGKSQFEDALDVLDAKQRSDETRMSGVKSLHREGVDKGSVMTSLEVLSLLLVSMAYIETQQISVGSVTSIGANAGSSVQANLVFLWIAQFGFIIVERAAFLMQSVKIKLILLWASILFYFLLIFYFFDGRPVLHFAPRARVARTLHATG